jgi:hypothetical protein
MSSTKPVLRCQHIKVDGVQCGSPALRGERRCHFHDRWNRVEANVKSGRALGHTGLPPLEDANSIQLALAEVMRLAIMGHVEYRVFALLLRALRIASANLKHLSPTPKPTYIVIDPESVGSRPLGATAWSETEGQDYDMIEPPAISNQTAKEASLESRPEYSADVRSYMRLVEGVARDPDFLNKPYDENPEDPLPPECRSENDQPDEFVRGLWKTFADVKGTHRAP